MLVWQRNNNNNNKQRRHNETFTFVGAKISDQSHCEIWWVGRRRWWVRRWKRVQRRLVTDSLVRASSLMLFIFSASHFGCNETETQIENMTNNCFKYPLDTLFTRREERVCQAITSVPKQRCGQKISFGDFWYFPRFRRRIWRNLWVRWWRWRWKISGCSIFGQKQDTSEATGAISFVSQFRFELAGSHL